MNIEGRCYSGQPLQLHKFPMLTARATGQSARFYGHDVCHDGKAHQVPQELLPSVPHIRITSLLREVANRHLCNSACPIIENRTAFCQSRPY